MRTLCKIRKKGKKIVVCLTIILALLFVFILSSVTQKGYFEVLGISLFDNDVSAESIGNELKDDFYISKKTTKEIISSPDEYCEIYIKYSITNNTNSKFMIIKPLPARLSNYGIYLFKYGSVSIDECVVKPGETESGMIPIVAKKDLYKKITNSAFSVNLLCLGYRGLFILNLKSHGEIDAALIEKSDFNELNSQKELFAYFVPDRNLNENVRFNSLDNALKVNTRECVNGFYAIIPFSNGSVGISCFNINGDLTNGMLFYDFDDKELDIKLGQTDFKTIQKQDKNISIFNCNGQYKSFRYHSNGTFDEITYKHSNGCYIVSEYKTGLKNDILSCLSKQDYDTFIQKTN